MDKTVLVEEDQHFGEQLIRALDERGFGVRSAFWVYFSDAQVWRLAIAADAARQLGQFNAVHRIREVLDEIGMNPDDLQLSDITLTDVDSSLVKAVRRRVRTEPDEIAEKPKRTGGFDADLQYFDDAIVYRVS